MRLHHEELEKYSPATIRRYIKRLLHNPAGMVARARFFEKMRLNAHTARALNAWQWRNRFAPLNSLSECYGRHCPNSRTLAPWRRQMALEHINHLANILYRENNGKLQCVFVGAGSLLQEAMVITRLVTSHSYSAISIILVDKLYAPHIRGAGFSRDFFVYQALFNDFMRWCCSIGPHIQWSFSIHADLDEIFDTGPHPFDTSACANASADTQGERAKEPSPYNISDQINALKHPTSNHHSPARPECFSEQSGEKCIEWVRGQYLICGIDFSLDLQSILKSGSFSRHALVCLDEHGKLYTVHNGIKEMHDIPASLERVVDDASE